MTFTDRWEIPVGLRRRYIVTGSVDGGGMVILGIMLKELEYEPASGPTTSFGPQLTADRTSGERWPRARNLKGDNSAQAGAGLRSQAGAGLRFCPSCHAPAHLREPPYSAEGTRAMLRRSPE